MTERTDRHGRKITIARDHKRPAGSQWSWKVGSKRGVSASEAQALAAAVAVGDELGPVRSGPSGPSGKLTKRRYTLPYSEEQMARWKLAADRAGLPVSVWVARLADEAAG